MTNKKEILIAFFENNAQATNDWLHHSIDELNGKKPSQILDMQNQDTEAIEFLHQCLESNVFLQKPTTNSLSKEEKRFLRDAGAKGIPD